MTNQHTATITKALRLRILKLAGDGQTILEIACRVGKSKTQVSAVLRSSIANHADANKTRLLLNQPIIPGKQVGDCPLCRGRVYLCEDGLCAACVLRRLMGRAD